APAIVPAPQTQAPAADGPVSLLPPPASAAGAPSLSQTLAPNTQTVSWTQHQPQPLTAPVAGFVVQGGAFSDPPTAERVRAAVQAAGAVSVDTRSAASGQLYRVRLGPYATREDAEAARTAVARLGYGEAIVAH